MDLKDQFDPILRKSLVTKKTAAIIPVGAIEQHGPHLPVSTDSDIVTEVTRLVSEKGNFLLLPTISYGVSFEHAPLFNISLKNTTLQKMLIDIILSLSNNKIKVVFVINGHRGNQKALANLEQRIKKLSKGKIKVFIFSYWHFMKNSFDHAGFTETSLMLTISKNVKMKKAKKGLSTHGMTKQQIAKISKLASKSFPKVTKNGVWGDPTKSTSKKGRIILSEIVKNLEKTCQTCLTGTNRNLHQ